MTDSQIALVVIDIRTKALDKAFSYAIPPHLVDTLQVGHRVRVPFARGWSQGYVIGIQPAKEAVPFISEPPQAQSDLATKLKPIAEILERDPSLTTEMIELTDWLCYRYACSRLEAIQAVLPSALRSDQGVGAKIAWRLKRLADADTLSSALQVAQRRAKKQARLLAGLLEQDAIDLSAYGVTPSDPAVKAIVSTGHALLLEVEVYRPPVGVALEEVAATLTWDLTVAQKRALTAIQQGLHDVTLSPRLFVLHGVTGSGKTEVYLQAIAACLAMEGGAIVLVPEIALTPQMVGRFTTRFGHEVAVLHSALSEGEKRDEWLRVRRGEARIVVGARSAVFAPVHNLKLLIVDEEHESSYKQEESPRYDAREVAEWRCRRTGGVVVYGSATPSLTIMHAVDSGKARLLTMPSRVNGRPLPPVRIVDMREELRDGNRSLFSRELEQGLTSAVTQGNQAILFLNRRGFAAFVLCRNCGETVRCPHCDISMTLHKSANGQLLVCHYCQYQQPYEARCPECGESAMRPFGIGTQQVEQAINLRWPEWRVLRMDVDTTRRKGAHKAAIQAFLAGEADILVGTQMIAKGLDFPNVAFVGVIAADTMLAVPDYRSAERTFSLLTQVAGRGGRADVDGTTVVQTYRPDHYAVIAAAHHDYATFYRQERSVRQMFGYPPFCELGVFLAVHAEENVAKGAASRFERELRRRLRNNEADILPAAPAGVPRVEDKYRQQVVVKYQEWEAVREAVVASYRLVYDKMRALHGHCTLDINAGRI